MVRIRNKVTGITLILLLLVSLTACASDDMEVEEESSKSTVEITESKTLDLDTWSLDDDTAFYCSGSSYYAQTEDGIYYWSAEGFLKFYDFASGVVVAVCNRADCLHEDDTCDAWFGSEYSLYQIYYYEENLYVIRCSSESGELDLYRVTPDGSTREKVMTLYEVAAGDGELFSYTMPELCIRDGYVYYVNMDEDVLKLRRAELGSSQSEIIFEGNESLTEISSLISNGDFLFFGVYTYTDNTYSDYDGDIYCYNCVSEEIIRLDAQYGGYSVENETLYYDKDSQIVARSLRDGTETVVYEDLSSAFFVAKGYIYFWEYASDSPRLGLYSMDGEEVAEVSGNMLCSFSYGDYLYVDEVTDVKEIRKIITIDDLISGNDGWITIDVYVNS